MGMLGMHGTVTANYAVHECDLLINLGARFDDRVTGKLKAFAPHAKIIHADVDPAEIGKNVAPIIPIVGDAKHVAAGLVKELQGMEWTAERTAEWLARIAERKEEFPLHYEDPKDGKLAPQLVIKEIDRITGHDAIICTDVGPAPDVGDAVLHLHRTRGSSSARAAWAPWASACRPHRRQDRPARTSTVIDISGDGGFQMTMQEMATAVSDDVPVVVCILNNGYLGMVRQWQDLFWDKRYSFTCIDASDCERAPGAHASPRRRRSRTSSCSPRRSAPSACGHREGRDRARAARGHRLRQAGGDRLQDLRRGERVSRWSRPARRSPR